MRLTRATSLISATVLALGLALSWVALAQPKAPAQKAPAKAQPPAKTTSAKPADKPAEKPPASTSSASPPASAPPAGGGTAGSAPLSGDTGADLGNIDVILQGEEEVLSGSGFSYDPGNRRDPFKSLLAGPDRPGDPGAPPRGGARAVFDEHGLPGGL